VGVKLHITKFVAFACTFIVGNFSERSFKDVAGVLLLVSHADFVHVAIFLHQ